MTPSSNQILYPLFAMFLLVTIVLLRMRSMRFAAVRAKQVSAEFYRTFAGEDEPEPLRVIARHFSNLFEVPVLFYVVVLMTYMTQHGGGWMVGCAWSYVALRYAHTCVHLTVNDVIVRFSLYFASNFVLGLLWLSLLIQLVRVG